MAIVVQLKIISVADFSSHYFKEVSSLSKPVEEILNRDTRLDVNKVTEQRPELEQVLQEIARNRSRNNKQKTKDDFPLLGLVTNRQTGMYSIKGKPILFRSRAKSAIDITIRNTGEFSNFLYLGKFQRQHISSLISQCFDPTFTFNAIYHNEARLINRRILQSTKFTMSMTYNIQKEHNPNLNPTLAQNF